MGEKQNLKIKLSDEKREYILSKIKKYFQEEREEDIGDLAASLLLDFIIKEFAAEFYNQGINDSYAYMSDKIEDIMGLQK